MKKVLRSLVPLSNAHWTLRLVLWFSVAYVLAWDQCAEKPRYLAVALITATVCITIWNSHVREMPIVNWKSMTMVLAGALHDLLLLMLWQLPLVLLVPTYDCYTTRAKLSELMSAAAPLMAEVDSRAKQHASLADSGAGLEITHGKYLSGGIVSKDGTIIEVSQNPPAVIMLVPEYSAGEVRWQCTGFPKESMSGDCRK